MKSLEQILRDNGYSCLDNIKEEIIDNENLLRSNTKNKREYAIKNLKMLFYGDKNINMKVIDVMVDKFLKEL